MIDRPWLQMGLSDREYEMIVNQLGREPNLIELNMYSVMWSEHCSYKHSRSALSLFPTSGPQVIQGPGENAGVVDLGDGWAAVFKIESHNHPSAVEPYQGAATGIGGILRDIFTMGAQPIAFLNSLRFGKLDDLRSRYLFDGVIAGIGGYGNCVGIPTVAGEIYFEECYRGNPLVNAMCVGIMPLERLVLGKASGEGNLVVLVGARTGRDGIHGVTFASEELSEQSEERRPAVQVGDPFLGKLLLEGTLEVIAKKLVTGVQDLGGAGLTCALTETAARAGSGVDIDLDQVPLREAGMQPFEILTSESQERMLLIVEPDKFEAVEAVFKRWELAPVVLGKVTASGKVVARFGGEEVVNVPAQSVSGGSPTYQPKAKEPDYFKELAAFDPLTLPKINDYNQALLDLLRDPDIASKEWVWRRYDYLVRTCTVQGPGGDAAVIRIRENGKALAMSVDGNSRQVYLDPYLGGMLAVAEATRNISCCGAEPLGITDCLNFGNPEKPEIYWQFRNTVSGMAEACAQLDVPVVGGNVSFYNEVEGEAIYPTPVIGVVGLLDNYEIQGRIAFRNRGDLICLLGADEISLGGSQLLKTVHGQIKGALAKIDLMLEKRLQLLVRKLILAAAIESAHDLAEGGLAVSLAECSMAAGLGASVRLPATDRPEVAFFGEGPSRILISVSPARMEAVQKEAAAYAVPLHELGQVKGDALLMFCGDDLLVQQDLKRAKKAYEEAFQWIMT